MESAFRTSSRRGDAPSGPQGQGGVVQGRFGVRTLRLAFAALVLAALLAAAGCGGGDSSSASSSSSSNTESADDWASGLCTALTTWTNSVRSAGNELKGNVSKDSLNTAADDIKSASDTLVSDLKDLGKPDTKQGQDAKKAMDQLSSEVKSDVKQMQSDVKNASGVQGAVTAASSVSTTLSTMGNQINSAASKLDQADPDGELKKAFQNSPDCKSLTSSSS